MSSESIFRFKKKLYMKNESIKGTVVDFETFGDSVRAFLLFFVLSLRHKINLHVLF